MSRHYYNEVDPKAAAWIKELIVAGEIPYGDVDERSICDVRGVDVRGYDQCHFFAGIGGWPLALARADVPNNRRLWTGSCPCPPFSCAGKKKSCPQCQGRDLVPHPLRTGVFACCACGHEWLADARHLWPDFYRLIAECRPERVLGEQVAGPDGFVWLAGVRECLEGSGYAVGAADLCNQVAGPQGKGLFVRGGVAAWDDTTVSRPHIRQRIYWLALSAGVGRDWRWAGETRDGGDAARVEPERLRDAGEGARRGGPPDGGAPCGLADATGGGLGVDRGAPGGARHDDEHGAHGDGGLADAHGDGRGAARGRGDGHAQQNAKYDGADGGVADAARDGGRVDEPGRGAEGRAAGGRDREGLRADPGVGESFQPGLEGLAGDGADGDEPGRERADADGPVAEAGDLDLAGVLCTDGRIRRTQPGTFPLVTRVPGGVVPGGDPRAPEDDVNDTAEARVVRLKGYGNALCIPTAVAFVRAAGLHEC